MTGSFLDPEEEPVTQRFNVSGEWWSTYQDFHIIPSISIDTSMPRETDVYFEWFKSYVILTIKK